MSFILHLEDDVMYYYMLNKYPKVFTLKSGKWIKETMPFKDMNRIVYLEPQPP